MKKFYKGLFEEAVGLAVLASPVLVIAYFLLWWYGIVAPIYMWNGLWVIPVFVALVLVLGTVPLSSLVLATFGFFASIYMLGFPWYWALVLYAPTLVVLVGTGAARLVVLGAGRLVQRYQKMFQR